MGDDAYVADWSGESARVAEGAGQRTRGAGAGCGGGVANKGGINNGSHTITVSYLYHWGK